jgi:hypothetical protein
MKKVLAIAVLGVFVLSSCKKDYTCSCTVLGMTTDSVLKDVKKKDAEKACDATSTSAAILGGSCTLK